jgi:hypothetical protein
LLLLHSTHPAIFGVIATNQLSSVPMCTILLTNGYIFQNHGNLWVRPGQYSVLQVSAVVTLVRIVTYYDTF